MNPSGQRIAEQTIAESVGNLERLPGLPVASYREAVSKLLHSPNPGIRRRALAIGVSVLADDQVVSLLREDSDDVLRSAGLEILKLRTSRGTALATRLLRDPDPNVVVQAVLALDHLRDSRALKPLCRALHHPNPSVAHAAIVAIGHLGTSSVIDELLPFLAAEPKLQMAAVQALGDLRSKKASKRLGLLLGDRFLGRAAAKSLAGIGGQRAFSALAEHWMSLKNSLVERNILKLMAHVVKGLSSRPSAPEGLRSMLIKRLSGRQLSNRLPAATCILGLGPGDGELDAVAVLARSDKNPSLLPACLGRRPDLILHLLALHGAPRNWGFLLAARHPSAISSRDFANALVSKQELHPLDAVVTLFRKKWSAELAGPLLELYLGLSLEKRSILALALRRHRAHLRNLFESRTDIDRETRVVVDSLLGGPVKRIVAAILDLPAESRGRVIRQLLDRPAVLKRLPWAEWEISDSRFSFSLAAQVAKATNLTDLLPVIRIALDSVHPEPAVILAVGGLRDSECTGILIRHLGSASPLTRSLTLSALGSIGGTEAREALRKHVSTKEPEEAHIAYMALSQCATEEDVAFFRGAASHPYWAVRFACAEGLARFPGPESIEALVTLSADPVNAVSRRALMTLES